MKKFLKRSVLPFVIVGAGAGVVALRLVREPPRAYCEWFAFLVVAAYWVTVCIVAAWGLRTDDP